MVKGALMAVKRGGMGRFREQIRGARGKGAKFVRRRGKRIK
jgi:hypothetical protein